MRKIKAFRIETKVGGGELIIFEKAKGGYFAHYSGLSGLAHEIRNEQEIYATNINFTIEDSAYDKLIENCRLEIKRRDSEILSFSIQQDLLGPSPQN